MQMHQMMNPTPTQGAQRCRISSIGRRVIRSSYLAASTYSQAAPIRRRPPTNRPPYGTRQPQVCPWPPLPHLPLPTFRLPWLSSPPPTHFSYNSRTAPPQPTMHSQIGPTQKPTTRPLPGSFSSPLLLLLPLQMTVSPPSDSSLFLVH